ncbi:MAG: YmdB family metallophosphoesterase [Alphaproteobacteria bacterium]|nr:MAG: YmdB family metallophosphoesterase [Alphaproteobacteria bacterium]
MKILFLGDVVGRSGRDAAIGNLKKLRDEHTADFIIVNVDNAAHGFGITPAIAEDFFAAGADCLTLGNHGFDQKEILGVLDKEPRLIRGNNYPRGTPGRGNNIFNLKDGRKIAVLHTIGRLFMDDLDCPFQRTNDDLQNLSLGGNVQAIFVDIHAEASSEKMALGHYLDGRVSAVVGTHTHIPTADCMVFPGGTAYQTDAGMCGDYNSVIGFVKDVPIQRYVRKMPTMKLEPALGPAQVRGCIVETDDKTGLAKSIAPIFVRS